MLDGGSLFLFWLEPKVSRGSLRQKWISRFEQSWILFDFVC